MRDLSGAPPVGAEEITRFPLIVLVFAAYPLVVHERENIVMTEIREALPGPLRMEGRACRRFSERRRS